MVDCTGRWICSADVVRAVYPNGRKLYGFAFYENGALKLLTLDEDGEMSERKFITDGESVPEYTVIGNLADHPFDEIVKSFEALEGDG